MKKNYSNWLAGLFVMLMPSFALAQCANIQWLNPSPQGNDLEDVRFISSDTVFAVGERGAMVRSVDRGEHWEALNQSTIYNLKSVWFTSSRVGYACGTLNNSGQIIKTLDGGDTWFELVSGYSQIGGSTCLWFTNDSVGYCGAFGKVYKTTNRGETWTGYSFPSSYTANDIYFTSPDTGFVVAGQYVYRTTNAGLNWTQRYATGSDLFTTLDFVNADTVYAGTTSSSRPFYRSLDGGNTWSAYTSAASGVFYGVDAVHFVNDTLGFASASAFNADLYKTTNGGTTWSIVYSSAYYLDFNGIASNDLGNYAVVGDLGEMVYSSGSANTGSWQSALSNLPFDVKAVDFINDQVGYMASTGRIHKTLDGGNTFTVTTLPVNKQPTVMQFATPDTGYVFGIDGYRFRTYNAGATWINYSVNNTTGDNWGCHFLSGKVGYVCGSGGYIAKTTNAGVNWSNLTNPGNTLTLRDVYFLNESVGFVCGSNGSFFRTMDGGVTWTTIPTGTTSAFFLTIEFYGNLGFVGGESGRLLKSVDGGMTWTNTTAGWGDSIYDIEMINEDDGFFAIGGFNSSFYRTYNGGQSWVTYAIAASDYVSDLDVLNDSTIVACGLTSAVWKIWNKVWDPPHITTVETCVGGTIHIDAPSHYDVRWVTNNYLGSYLTAGTDISASLFAQSDTVFITYMDSLECFSAMRRVVVNLNENPEPPILETANLTFCDGSSTTLFSTDGSPVEWSNGEMASSIVVNSAGDFYARKLLNGCYSDYSDTLFTSVLPAPSAPLVTMAAYDLCSPAYINFESDNPQTRWSLFSEDAEIVANGQSFVTPLLSANTTVSAFSESENGCRSENIVQSIPFSIVMDTPQLLDLHLPLCSNGSVTVAVEENENYSVEWNEGSTTSSIVVSEPGSYSARYFSNGCYGPATANAEVELIEVPAPAIGYASLAICEGDSTLLFSADSVYWSNGVYADSIYVRESGAYSAYQEIQGCFSSSSSAFQVDVQPLPLAVSTLVSEYNPCAISNVELSTADGASVYWYNALDAAPLGVGESIVIEALADSATFYVQSISALGCEGPVSEILVPVSLAPAPPAITVENASFCEGGNASLAAAYEGQIIWSTGETESSIVVSESAVVSAVSVVGNCTSSPSEEVEITELPVPAAPIVSVDFQNFCEGTVATASASGEGSIEWWNGEVGNSIVITSSADVSAIAVLGACASASSDIISVVEHPLPATPAITLEGTNVLVATPAGAESYIWFGDNFEFTTSTNTLEVANTEGFYSVIAVSEFGCSSAPSDAFHFVPNAIDEDLLFSTLIWPNPATDLVTVQSQQNMKCVRVYNALGQLVLEENQVNASRFSIPTNTWMNGVYQVKIQSIYGIEQVLPVVIAH